MSRFNLPNPETKRKFPLGRLLITPGAAAAMADSGHDPIDFVMRHERGDWGKLCEEDRITNDRALQSGLRLMSVYSTLLGVDVWIITEADRSSTTILLPQEY